MLREIEKAVEALKQVPPEYRTLVLAEAGGGTAKRKGKPGPKPGSVRKPGAKKPGPKPGFKKKKAVEGDDLPVKVDPAKLEKLKKLKEK